MTIFGIKDDADEYTYQEEDAQDDEFDDDDFLNFRTDVPDNPRNRRMSSPTARRRSSRTAAKLNMNGKREGSSDSWGQWRGERRSSRLGAPPEVQLDYEPPPKRARTEESTMSAHSVDIPSNPTNGVSEGAASSLKIKISGAAALRPTEIAMEQVAGKKKSKFWVYAVEPIPGAAQPPLGATEGSTNDLAPSDMNGHSGHNNDNDESQCFLSHRNGNGIGYERSLEGSLSPLDST